MRNKLRRHYERSSLVALDLLALSNCRQITSDFSGEEEKGEKSRTREENEEHHDGLELRLG